MRCLIVIYQTLISANEPSIDQPPWRDKQRAGTADVSSQVAGSRREQSHGRHWRPRDQHNTPERVNTTN